MQRLRLPALMKELIEFCARVSTKYWLPGSPTANMIIIIN